MNQGATVIINLVVMVPNRPTFFAFFFLPLFFFSFLIFFLFPTRPPVLVVSLNMWCCEASLAWLAQRRSLGDPQRNYGGVVDR